MKEVFRYGKCIFARPRLENADDMVEMMNDPEIAKWLFNEYMEFTKDMEVCWINNHQEDNNFSVYDAETEEYIGNAGFKPFVNNRAEVGLVIRRQMQGKHYAKDIIKGLVEYGFNNLGLDEIYAIVFSDNVRSLNCVTELGFKEYDRVEHVIDRDGVPVDDVYLQIKKQ